MYKKIRVNTRLFFIFYLLLSAALDIGLHEFLGVFFQDIVDLVDKRVKRFIALLFFSTLLDGLLDRLGLLRLNLFILALLNPLLLRHGPILLPSFPFFFFLSF